MLVESLTITLDLEGGGEGKGEGRSILSVKLSICNDWA